MKTNTLKFDLFPILVSSLCLLAGGLIGFSPLGSWPFIFLAGLSVGITSIQQSRTYLVSLAALAVWIFIGYYSLLEYSFRFPVTGYEKYYLEPVVALFDQVVKDEGFDVVVWILILLINWFGVFVGSQLQSRLTRS